MTRTHKIVTALLLAATPAVASPSDHRAPAPDAEVPPRLRELRQELLNTGRDKALAAVARFRPLCDKDGYPLVGNLATKGDMYQPSQFCADVRQAAKRR